MCQLRCSFLARPPKDATAAPATRPLRLVFVELGFVSSAASSAGACGIVLSAGAIALCLRRHW
jgi:hypothetical protein